MTGRTGQRGGRAGQQRDLATRAHGARDDDLRPRWQRWLVPICGKWMIFQESQRRPLEVPTTQPGCAARADMVGDEGTRRPASSLERFRQKRASSSSGGGGGGGASHGGTSPAGGISNENESPRQPRGTPSSRPSTGDKLAALKARRSAARPASGRRAAEDATTAPGIEPRTTERAGRPSRTPILEATFHPNLDDAAPNALATSNEWREFDPRGSFGRARTAAAADDALDAAGDTDPSGVARRVPPDENDDDTGRTPAASLLKTTRRQPRTHASTPSTAFRTPPPTARGIEPRTTESARARRAATTRSPGDSPPRVSHSEPAVVAVHTGEEPDLKLADACLAVEESTTDVGGGGGVRVTLNRPRTTLKKTYELSTVVSNSNECFDKTGFAAATRAAVLDGVSCALITTGIHGSGKSRLVRGHGADGGADHLGACGYVASVVFDAVDEVKASHPGDVVTVAVSAIADVITAPVAPGVPVARRKTHEVLVDALAAGIELASAHRDADEDEASRKSTSEEDDNVRGGRGGGAGAVSAVFHGATSSVGVNVREHPTRGFYAEGCVEIVAEDAEDCARLVALASDGFRAKEREVRESGRATSALAASNGSFAGERVHCLLALRITRRSARGRLDPAGCGVWLPETETTSEIVVADVAGIDRKKGSSAGGGGAAEDAAVKAFGRCVDALADSRSHVPYRDSKFTRLVSKALSGIARLFAVVCVSRNASRHDESDAALQLARKIRRGVRATGGKRAGDAGGGPSVSGPSMRPRPDHRVAYAAECERLDEEARDLAERLGVSIAGLTSGAVALDMESGDDLLALRDALAEGERLRAEVGRGAERAERSRRVRERFLS